ncbi:HAD-IC family P-type ATPase [Arcanobacterium pinnipediorum]|uniref:HAD-IC family P-type ATPase n=1 Tax=Arcanobacterium pinnipediorum TaxID=1503041 RepID=A0ABY5AJG0_9ACTO|nr:HAD-IC family P-type ATPase [Arcanobacterium pinnipediorum]USR79328.1 HAD-IC family P-type ATPase [Arcanobacterium pinnipediorum]
MSQKLSLGLTSEEVADRRRDGRVNTLPPRTGKTVGDIIRSNVFTRINAMLSVLFVMVMTTGSIINAAFGLLIIVNSGIGIVQELRAKRTLDSLSLIGEEKPRVWRDGKIVEVAQEDVVLDDVIALRSGNQIVVDGEVVDSDGLSIDESMLTGESDAVRKQLDDEILSGSFVVSGTGAYRVTKVGADSYAARLTAEASRFTLAKSQLQSGINTILKYITWVLIPVGILIIYSQVSQGTSQWDQVILKISGALVPMIPEGLVLITSTAFALGVIRLGKRKCLVQELPAIEGLARVDVVCADKTGTLTENRMIFESIRLFDDEGGLADSRSASGTWSFAQLEEVLGQLGGADQDPNSTMAAIIEAHGLDAGTKKWEVRSRHAFTSATKWSGITFAEHGSWLLGAADVLAEGSAYAKSAQELGSTGLRVIMLAHTDQVVDDDTELTDVEPVALVVFEQKVRPDAAQTLEYFAEQNVTVKVISGDNAASVGAVTRKLGVDSGQAIDARTLTSENFDAQVANNLVFGRVTPDQKRSMVASLQEAGHTVAMTGDGVNDVLALKDADIGVAMGSGAPATRSVAKIVLLDDKFATLPYVVAEGRRVIGNIERVANLFLTKTIYSAVLAILVIISAIPFPFQPIHVTITGWFTIGIPAFVLSLPPNNQRARSGFVRRVLWFAVPAGVVVGISAFVSFWAATGGEFVSGQVYVEESTAALLALIIPSTWVLVCIARPLSWWKSILVVLPLLGYGVIFTWDFTQKIFMLDSSNGAIMQQAAIIGLVAAVLIEGLWWTVKRYQGEPTILWRNDPLLSQR